MLTGFAPLACMALLAISPSAPTTTPTFSALAGGNAATSQDSKKQDSSKEGKAKKPKLGKVEPQPVKLRTSDKLELDSTYFSPYRTKGKRVPGVLMVHDQGSNSQDLYEIAAYLSDRGMGVLVLELRGHGTNAKEDYDWKKADEKQQQSMWAFSTKDLEAGAQFLGGRKELHNTKLVVMGHGKGCSLAVEHAIKNRNTMVTVLIQPAKKVYDFDLKERLLELDGIPTLLLCAKEDRKNMVAVQEACTPKNVDEPTCQVTSVTSKAEEVLEDKRITKAVHSFVAHHTSEK